GGVGDGPQHAGHGAVLQPPRPGREGRPAVRPRCCRGTEAASWGANHGGLREGAKAVSSPKERRNASPGESAGAAEARYMPATEGRPYEYVPDARSGQSKLRCGNDGTA